MLSAFAKLFAAVISMDMCVCVCEYVVLFVQHGWWQIEYVFHCTLTTASIDLKHNAHPQKNQMYTYAYMHVQSSRNDKENVEGPVYVWATIHGLIHNRNQTIPTHILYQIHFYIMIKCTAEERMMRWREDDRKWYIFAYRGFNKIVSMFTYSENVVLYEYALRND